MQSSVIPVWHKYGRAHKSASLALPMEERKVAVIKTINWLMLQDTMDMRPSVFVDGICELWDSPSCQLSSADLITASLLWLCIMLGWSDHCLPIMGSQQAAVLSLSTGTSSHLSDEFWQNYTLCYSFCNIYHSSNLQGNLLVQTLRDVLGFDLGHMATLAVPSSPFSKLMQKKLTTAQHRKEPSDELCFACVLLACSFLAL